VIFGRLGSRDEAVAGHLHEGLERRRPHYEDFVAAPVGGGEEGKERMEMARATQ